MGKERKWRRFSATESAEIWDRWQRGEGLKLIGRVFGKNSSSIFAHLRPHGGIRPVQRRRSGRSLSLAEREEISRGVATGASLRSIAARLGRSPSTVSRELRRNGGYPRYRAAAADRRAWGRALRPKACKLSTNDDLRRIVAGRLEANWSPQQIAGWLRRAYPDDEAYQVSHSPASEPFHLGLKRRERSRSGCCDRVVVAPQRPPMPPMKESSALMLLVGESAITVNPSQSRQPA